MAKAAQPPPVKLICGMLSGRADLLGRAREALAKVFGPVDLAGDMIDFDFTDYYEREMGGPLLRQLVSFADLAAPDSLVQAKHATNAIEAEFAASVAGVPPARGEGILPLHGAGPARPVNLDVGYVDSPKLVLASMKNFAHRVYLGRGVYAEVTLLYRRGLWTPLEWTFPDYASGRYWPFLEEVRRRLRERLGRERPA